MDPSSCEDGGVVPTTPPSLVSGPRGLAVVPNRLEDHLIGGDLLELVTALSGLLGLRVVQQREYRRTLLHHGDTLLTFLVPSNVSAYPHRPPRLAIPADCRVIHWIDDGQWADEAGRVEMRDHFDRADLILCANRANFDCLWGGFRRKAEWLPHYAPETGVFETVPESPAARCLLAGRVQRHWYPIRHRVARSSDQFRGRLTIVPHPGYEHHLRPATSLLGRAYATALRQHFCCVTDSARTAQTVLYDLHARPKFDETYLRWVTGRKFTTSFREGLMIRKYFEIPAAGSLLVADDATPDIARSGLVPGVHFVACRVDDVVDVINTVLDKTDAFEDIRRCGHRFVLMHHRLRNRVGEAAGILTRHGFAVNPLGDVIPPHDPESVAVNDHVPPASTAVREARLW